MAPDLRAIPYWLSYVDRLDERPLEAISLVVVHCTELPDLAMAREYGERIHYPESGTGNAGHYYIDRDGSLHQFVPLDRIAHHVTGHNAHSIGIELVNRGRYPDWHHSGQQAMLEPYPADQISALIGLLEHLRETLPGLSCIAGHEDLDTRRVPASDDPEKTVQRKMDPGPQFPWAQVLGRVALERMGGS